MSYCIHPFAVSLQKVEQAVGSKKAGLIKTLKGKFRRRYDLDREEQLEEDDVLLEEAVRQLIMGEQLARRFGFQYGYALKVLCEHFGKMLSNGCWSAVRWEWAEEVDQALANAGVNAKVFRVERQLMTRGSPIPIPPIDDFPSIGYVLETELPPIIRELTPEKTSSIEDEEIRGSVAELRGWFDHCSMSRKDLVCFYH